MIHPRLFTVALPKKGRLSAHFNTLFEAAGYMLDKKSARHDFALAVHRDDPEKKSSFQALLQKAEDALENLQDGLVDATITGRDKYEEVKARQLLGGKAFKGCIAASFNFSACALMVAARPGRPYHKPADLKGKKIATSYPATLRKWLHDNEIGTNDVHIISRTGGIEDYVRLGTADAICDLVESGRSLHENNLVPYFNIHHSQALLVIHRDTPYGSEIENLHNHLQKAAQELYAPASGYQNYGRPEQRTSYAAFGLTEACAPQKL